MIILKYRILTLYIILLACVSPHASAISDIAKVNTMKNNDLIIISPIECRVFQRQSKYSGPVLVSGYINGSCDTLEYRISGTPLKGKFSGKWTRAALDPVTHMFNQRIDVPAGGWYKLDIRALLDGKSICEKSVEKFGVGEVFVGAGQSNSTSCGQFPTKQTSGMVSNFSGEVWEIRDDPLPGSHDYDPSPNKMFWGSYYLAFGDAMYQKYHVPIGIVSTGQGGSSVEEWHTGGELFKFMMNRIGQLGPGGFRAVLWHQGEANVDSSPDIYYQNMATLIRDSNRLAGWSFPWFIATASYQNKDNPLHPTLRGAQQKLWKDGIALEGPDTDTLTGDMRDYDGTGIHLSVKGLTAHGKLWADKVSIYLDALLENPAKK